MAIVKAKINNPTNDAALQKEIDALQSLIDAKAKRLQQKAALVAKKASQQSAAERKLDSRKKIIIGAALVAEAKNDATLKAALDLLMRKLDASEKSAAARTALGLKPLPSAAKPEAKPTTPAAPQTPASAAATSAAQPKVTQPTAATTEQPKPANPLGSFFNK